MRSNPGKQPPETRGHRVKVRLRNGNLAKGDWAADGKQGCRWTLTDSPFDILEFEVVK